MLRVTTLYASTATATAQYYTRYLTQADGEQPGQWTGLQADLLGLSGEVTTEDLQALLEGRDPITGSPLGYPLLDRVTASGKVVHAVAGFDATLSAPKSLSVWWALSRDDGLAACHDVAVRAVVDFVERYGSTTRIRRDGRRLHPDSQGLTAAVFRQTTSRLDDPQLHSHVVISAKVQTDDGHSLLDQRDHLTREHSHLCDHARHNRWLIRALDNHDDRIETAQESIGALNTWHRWASGHGVTPDELNDAAAVLRDTAQQDHATLAAPLVAWLEQHGLARTGIEIDPAVRPVEFPTLDL